MPFLKGKRRAWNRFVSKLVVTVVTWSESECVSKLVTRQRQQRRQQCQILARILREIVQSDFFNYQNEITSAASFFLCSSPWLVCLFSFRYWTGGQLKNTLQEKSLQDSKFWLACWMVCFNMDRGIHIFSFVINPQSRLFQSVHHRTLLASHKK